MTTYRQLLENMSDEELDQEVTVFVQDEFYPAEVLVTDEEEDRLDPGHIYFKIKDAE